MAIQFNAGARVYFGCLRVKPLVGGWLEFLFQEIFYIYYVMWRRHSFEVKVSRAQLRSIAKRYSVKACRKMCEAYKAYFGMPVGDQDRSWAPHFTCEY